MYENQSGPSPARRFPRAELPRLVPLTLVAALGLCGLCQWAFNSTVLGPYVEGPAYSLAQLEALYPAIPPQENAAPLYIASFDPMVFTRQPVPWVNPDVPPPEPAEPIPDSMRTAMADFLNLYAPALDKLYQAATYTQCRYPIRLEDGMAVDLPHLSKLRHASRLLHAETALAAENGDGVRAVRALTAGLALARSLANEPLVISQLVRFACIGITLDSLERVLNRIVLTDEQLQTLAQAVGRAEMPGAFVRALQGESYMAMICLGNWKEVVSRDTVSRETPMDAVLSDFAGLYMQLTPVGLFDRAMVVLARDREVAAGRKPYAQRLTESAAGKQIERSPQARKTGHDLLLKQSAEWERLDRLFALLAGPVAPLIWNSRGVLDVDARCAARIRAGLCAVAVERFRLARHALPTSLDQLVPAYLPEVPKDPYDDAEMRYQLVEPKGYTVRSAGLTKPHSPERPVKPRDEFPMIWIEH